MPWKIFINGRNFKKKKITKLDGILMDLGVSSPQLDDSQRGLSFKSDGLLDMRMNQNHTETAADIVNNYDINELAYIFKVYGEERFAKRVAKFIVQYREEINQINSKGIHYLLEYVTASYIFIYDIP